MAASWSAGQLSDVRELVLALQGDRKDMATVERVLRNIGDSLARGARSLSCGARGQPGDEEPGGQVISIAFDRRV